MKHITCPAPYTFAMGERSVFLAGGITNCPPWQDEMVQLLAGTDLVLLNPRRAEWPIGDPTASEAQIRWEHEYLRYADAILFWFPCETLCPITLYELGAWSMVPHKPIFIGVHPDYARRADVEIQTKLTRRDVQVVYSLATLVTQVRAWEGAE